MSPARHTTHNPRHGLGSRLGWPEISTGGTTPMPDSARADSPWAKSEKVTVWSHEREQRFDTSNLFFNL